MCGIMIQSVTRNKSISPSKFVRFRYSGIVSYLPATLDFGLAAVAGPSPGFPWLPPSFERSDANCCLQPGERGGMCFVWIVRLPTGCIGLGLGSTLVVTVIT